MSSDGPFMMESSFNCAARPELDGGIFTSNSKGPSAMWRDDDDVDNADILLLLVLRLGAKLFTSCIVAKSARMSAQQAFDANII